MNIAEENPPPAWLKRLRVTKVALVDQGANEHAHINFYKRQEPDMSSQTAIFKSIADGARNQFPDLPEHDAVTRFVETEEGRELALRHSQAQPDYEPQETIEKAERVGGDQAELLAKRLDLAAQEYALTHNVDKESAYDSILGSAEGMELRRRYDQLVRG